MSQSSDLDPPFAKRPKFIANASLFTTQDWFTNNVINPQPEYIPEENIQESIIRKYTLRSTKESLKSEEINPRTFRRAKADVRKTLEAVHHVAISIEPWKWGVDDIRTMYTATAHFIYESKFMSQTLFTINEEMMTLEDVGDKLYAELKKWNLIQKDNEKIVCFITTGGDCGSLLKNIIDLDYGWRLNVPHLFCVADAINLVIQNSLIYINFEELVTQFEDFNKKKNDPKSWNSQYNTLKNICVNNAGDFADDERKILCEFYQILKPFEDFNRKLATEKYLPLSVVIPLINDFKLEISKSIPSNVFVKELWEKLMAIDYRYDVDIALKSTFMDPRFKTIALSQKGADDLQQNLIKELRDSFKNNRDGLHSSNSNNELEKNEKVDNDKTVIETRNKFATDDPAKSILSYYASIPDCRQDEDHLKFWSDFNRFTNCDQFSKMAEKYLCIPANATPLSRKFGWVKIFNKRLIYKRRHLLEFDNIDKVLFMQSYNSRIKK